MILFSLSLCLSEYFSPLYEEVGMIEMQRKKKAKKQTHFITEILYKFNITKICSFQKCRYELCTCYIVYL